MRPKAATALVFAAARVTWVVDGRAHARHGRRPRHRPRRPLGWFLGVWVTMMAAMMLPVGRADGDGRPPAVSAERPGGTAGPAAPATTRVRRRLPGGVDHEYGLVAYGDLPGRSSPLDPAFLAWDRQGPLVAGAAVADGGPLPAHPAQAGVPAALPHAPRHWVMHRWRPGGAGAVAMGAEHGAWCIGCCWALMVVLFALGVMSIAWMALVAAARAGSVEGAAGRRAGRARRSRVVLVAVGIWVARRAGERSRADDARSADGRWMAPTLGPRS